jgi:hypothetical protein
MLRKNCLDKIQISYEILHSLFISSSLTKFSISIMFKITKKDDKNKNTFSLGD